VTNYIEHKVETRQVDGNEEEHDVTVFWAVRPSPEPLRWRKRENPDAEWGEWSSSIWSNNAFVIYGGQSVHVYDQSDIDGLRGLLDEIEAQFKADEALK